jgi:hypothetical protein
LARFHRPEAEKELFIFKYFEVVEILRFLDDLKDGVQQRNFGLHAAIAISFQFADDGCHTLDASEVLTHSFMVQQLRQQVDTHYLDLIIVFLDYE